MHAAISSDAALERFLPDTLKRCSLPSRQSRPDIQLVHNARTRKPAHTMAASISADRIATVTRARRLLICMQANIGVQPRRANGARTEPDALPALAGATGRRDHFGVWFVIALIVRLVKGTLVPFLVAAPKVHE